MSNSDKEFEEFFKKNFDERTLDNESFDSYGKKIWNHLYPYKERCETLEAKVKELEKEVDEWKTEAERAQLCEELEILENQNQPQYKALLIEACETLEAVNDNIDIYIGVNWHEDSDVNGTPAEDSQKLIGDFLYEKPEIKKLLEGVKSE